MTRYIDADALCRHLSDWQYGSLTDGKHDVEYGVIENVIEGIEKEPTIEAVPVIRCANCKYYSTETEQTAVPNMRKCTWWRNIGTFPIDFCSRAERRGEEWKE